MGLLNVLSEELKKPIYSKQEADLENQKSLSTSSNEGDYESDHISYDPFSKYTNNSLDDHTGFANRKEIIGKWRKAVWNPEVDEGVMEIIGEAIVFDEQEKVIDINLDNVELSKKIKEKIIDSFNNIMFMLDFNQKGEELFKKWYVDGQLNLEVIYDNNKIKDGIQKLIVLTPFNIWRIKNEKTNEVKFIMKDEKPGNEFAVNIKKAERIFEAEQITNINSGLWSADGKTPMSYLQKAVKTVNQLNLLEDSVVIWHITRSPEKRVFYIDTGNLPKSKAEEYIKRLIAKYRQKKIYNADTGSLENRSKSISILEDFWLPRNAAGRGTEIDTLGAQASGMEQMDHIEYFVNKIYKALNIPRSRRSQDANIVINNTIDIEKDELKFFKFILKLRRRFNNMFVDLLKKDLLAKQIIKIEDWRTIQEAIKFNYANNNPYSDIKKMQILQMRMDITNAAMDMVEHEFLSKTWIRREILDQTEDEIDAIQKEIDAERADGDTVGSDGEEDGTEAQPPSLDWSGNGSQPPNPTSQAPADNTVPPASTQGTQKKMETGPSFLTNSLMADLAALIKSEVTAAIQSVKEESSFQHKTDLINSLKEGDIISNGTEQLILKNGKLIPYKED